MVIESLKIDRKSHSSVSRQIELFLKKKILNKELHPGDRLPTTVEIMKSAKVGANTVREAMARLVEAGLIECTPGRGTFIKKIGADAVASIDRNSRTTLKKVCVVGAVSSSSEGSWYRRLTVSGVMKQCNAFGTSIISLTRKHTEVSSQELYEMVLETESDGVIWLLPEPCHWDTVESLSNSNTPLVVVRNCHGNDGFASVEVDYGTVGFEAGRFLTESGCDGVLLFTRIKADFASDISIRHGLWPSSISFGFQKAFRYFNSTGNEDAVIELSLGGHYCSAKDRFAEAIKNYGPQYGLFFIDPMYLAHYLVQVGDDAVASVKGRKIVMINNWDNYPIFAPYAHVLDMYSFMDQPEEVGVLAVQKLSSLVDGHLANTVTSLQLSLEKYSPMRPIRQLVEEINIRESE